VNCALPLFVNWNWPVDCWPVWVVSVRLKPGGHWPVSVAWAFCPFTLRLVGLVGVWKLDPAAGPAGIPAYQPTWLVIAAGQTWRHCTMPAGGTKLIENG